MTVLIVKNITREGLGLLQELLDEHSIPYYIVDLDKGELFPDPHRYKAVVVLGGPDSANDTTPKMQQELQRIRETVKAEIPYLGACLGMQTLVKANGGEVYRNALKELGWRGPDDDFFSIELTSEGRVDPLFRGLESKLNIFHLHGETVKLGPNMVLLATGKYCQVQAVRVGSNAYGYQGHFELTPEMFETWITQDSDLIPLDREALRKDYALIRQEYEATGKQILTNWLKIANLIK